MKFEIILFCFVLLGCLSLGASTPKVHKFETLAEYCDGVRCPSTQFCDNEAKACINKYLLGETCKEVGQCKTSYGECLANGDDMTCQCKDKFSQAGEDLCVPACTDNTGCSRGTFCNLDVKGCMSQVDLNQDCKESAGDGQCKTENAECNSGKCKCEEVAFVELNGSCIGKCNATSCGNIAYCEASGLCKPKSYLEQSCDSTFDSCLIENSECNGANKCACKGDFVTYYGSCLERCEANDICTSETPDQYCDLEMHVCTYKASLHQGCELSSTDQCLQGGSECRAVRDRQPTCECVNPGFIETNGQCVAQCQTGRCSENQFCSSESGLCEEKRQIGQNCSATGAEECTGTQVECAGDPPRCSCTKDFYEFAGECKEKCVNNGDCLGQYCHKESEGLGMCTPLIPLNGFCNIKDTFQCRNTEAICKESDGVTYCKCNGNFVEEFGACITKCSVNSDCNTNNNNTRFCHTTSGLCKNKIDLGGTCLDVGVEQCGTANAICEPDQPCKCDDGFAEKERSCVVKCASSSTCGANEYCNTESSVCWEKARLGQNCNYDDQCSTPDATCGGPDNNKKCICKSGDFAEYFGTCLLKCSVDATQCSNSQYCQSSTGFCLKKRNLGQSCNEENECMSDLAICDRESSTSASKTCRCNSAANQIAGNCVAKCTKASGCDATEFCSLDNGFCYKRSGANGVCLEESATDQCLGNLISCVKNAEEKLLCLCSPNSSGAGEECKCDQGFVESNDIKRCLKQALVIEGDCEEPQQCTLLGGDEAVGCDIADGSDDGSCRCNAGFLNKKDMTKCLKIASVLGDTCEEPEQCTSLGKFEGNMTSTDCVADKCDCSSANGVKNEGRCYLKRVVGQSCENVKECSVGGIEGSVGCESNKCVCTSGTKEADGGKSCKAAAGGVSSIFQINTFLISVSTSLILFARLF